jgi:hypothetical protein
MSRYAASAAPRHAYATWRNRGEQRTILDNTTAGGVTINGGVSGFRVLGLRL